MPTSPDQEELDQAFMKAHDRDPQPESWGLYAYSDAPPNICGSGQGRFLWFNSPKEMLEFTREFLAWWHPGPSSMEPEEIAGKVATIVDDWKIVDVGKIDELQDSLNDSMKNMWHIKWWGEFRELTDGDSEFAVETREDFFGDTLIDDEGEAATESGEEPPTAIEKEELKEFKAFLGEYGI